MKRSGRKSAAQTPSPAKDRVYGSKKNPKGSASSKASAVGIILSDSITKTLEGKRDEFNSSHPSKKVSLPTLKAVMRRGMGAYSTSYRPTITGGAPNSRQAWGFARVNKFLLKKGGTKVKAAYVQDDDLMAKGGVVKVSYDIHNIDYDSLDELFDDGYGFRSDMGIGEPHILLLEENKIIGCIFLNNNIFWDDSKDYEFDIVIKEDKRGKGYSKLLIDEMINDFVNNFKNSSDIIANVINDELSKYLISKYGFVCLGNGGMSKYDNICYLTREKAIDYLKNNKKMEGGGEVLSSVKKFYDWFINWYKDGKIYEKMNIFISIPNELTNIDTKDDYIIFDLFEKIDQNVDAKKYMEEITSKADEFGVSIYLEAIPRYKHINSELKKEKISSTYLIDYYKKFGFQVIDKVLMKRTPKSKLKGGGLIAPNGKKSNLTPEQYKLVRTPQFKAWFGDWENDPENASKVVDENGEPLVVYRGMPKKRKVGNVFKYNVNLFGTKGIGGRQTNKFAFYFTDIKQVAEDYVNDITEDEGGYVVKSYFLNVRNLFKAFSKKNQYETTFKELYDLANTSGKPVYFKNYRGEIETDYKGNKLEVWNHTYEWETKYKTKFPNRDEPFSFFVDWNKEQGNQYFWRLYLEDYLKYDGLVFYETTNNATRLRLGEDLKPKYGNEFSKTYGVFEPNQIKLADCSNTTFDANNPDIRYEDGGEMGKDITCVNCGHSWNTSNSEEYDKYVCHKCGFNNRTFYDSEPIDEKKKSFSTHNNTNMKHINLPDTISSLDKLQPILAAQGYELKELMKPTKSLEQISEDFDVPVSYLEKQLEIGTEHETEHSYSRDLAKTTALHHLAEDPEYYIRLKEMEMKREAKNLDDYYKMGGALSGETTCEVLDKEGERKIDEESISNMTECLENLPQTKSMHFDYENNDYKPYRKRLHRDIIYEFKKDLVCVEREEPIAILMGGSPASGKSTFLKKYAPYLLKEEILKIDADEIRAKLPEYRGYNASQTHLETKDIVNTLLSDRNIGIPCRFDVIYDGTMNSTKSYLPLIDILKREGYKVFIVYIDKVPKDVVINRSLERYKKSGRFVPLEVVDDFFSKGKEALELLKGEVDGYMVVDGSSTNYKIIQRGGDSIPQDRNYSKIGEPIEITSEEVIREFAKGGQLNPDDPKVKSTMTHKSGSAGGLLVGNRHSEGGIKAVNKSTNQPLEMEGGEVVITRDAVSDDTKREFEGEMLSNRDILSRINQSGGGVSFADGGDVPEKCACAGKEYNYGGKLMKDNDIVENIMTSHRKMFGIKYPDLLPSEAMKKIFNRQLKFEEGGELYGEGGTLTIINKRVPTFISFSGINKDISPQNMKNEYKKILKDNYRVNFDQLPHLIQSALMIGNQKLVDNYINS